MKKSAKQKTTAAPVGQQTSPMSPDDDASWRERERYTGPVPRPFEVWTGDDGWCSVCLADAPAVVLFGTRLRYAGICHACLARIAAVVPQSSTAPEKP